MEQTGEPQDSPVMKFYAQALPGNPSLEFGIQIISIVRPEFEVEEQSVSRVVGIGWHGRGHVNPKGRMFTNHWS